MFYYNPVKRLVKKPQHNLQQQKNKTRKNKPGKHLIKYFPPPTPKRSSYPIKLEHGEEEHFTVF